MNFLKRLFGRKSPQRAQPPGASEAVTTMVAVRTNEVDPAVSPMANAERKRDPSALMSSVSETRTVAAVEHLPAAADVPSSDATQPAAERQTAEDQVPAEWQPGDVILDLYEVQQVFESGGMGLVYQVHHKGWNLPLAVKSPRAEWFESDQDKQNFEREAETWVNLGLHPNIVSCHYVRRLGGIPRVFAEYMEGGSLKDWIDSGKLYTDGPESALERMLDIAIQFAWGLHYAHEQGLIHQDVKAANVLMTNDGIAKVSDFGLAKAQPAHRNVTASRAGASILVSTGGMTPAYCSPEQANQQPLSRRTDLWSWAVSLLEMFTGDVTWTSGVAAGEALEGYLDSGGSGDDRIALMPLEVADLLKHCFQRDPAQRPKDMLEVVESLRSLFRQIKGEDYPRKKPNAAELLADWRNNQAVSLLDLGRRDEAERKWQEALGMDPHHPDATYNWGLIKWRLLRMTDLQLLEKLREVRTASADAAHVDYLLGLVHLERADPQAAVDVLSKAVETDSGRAEIATALASAQSLSGSSEQLPSTFEGHTSIVLSVSFSPDGRYALSGSLDTTLMLWEVSSGRCLRTYEGHTEGVNSVSWSPDGRFILSVSKKYDQTMRLWEVSSGRCLRCFEGDTNTEVTVSWSPDGRYALSGSCNELQLWDVSSGKCLRTFEGHTFNVSTVSFSPDGHYALSGSLDKTVRLWKLSSGKCLRTFEGHTSWVNSVSFSPDGRYALSGSKDKMLRLWEVESGNCLRVFEGHKDTVTSVSFSPNGCYALSGSWDKTLRLWEVNSGQCLRTFEGHRDIVTSVSFSPDGRNALSGSQDKTLRLWGIGFAKHPMPLVTSMAFAVNSALYNQLFQQARDAVASNPAVAAGFLQRARLQPGCSRREEPLELARLLSRSLAHRHFVSGWEKRTFTGHRSGVKSVSWSPDGRYALSGSGHTFLEFADRIVRLWDISSGECLRTFEGHTSNVLSVSFSPDGHYALSGSKDKILRLWDVSSGECLRTFEGHTESVTSVLWSPDGRNVLSGSEDKTLRLWDVSSGHCLGGFGLYACRPRSVSWSPDGRYVLSGSDDKTLRLWEVSGGDCLRTFEGHTSWVNSVSFSPDGRYALSGSADKMLRLWEVCSGDCLRTFEGHTDSVTSVSWSPDGRYVVSGSEDKMLRLWELDWEFEFNQPADWDEGTRPFLNAFLTVHTPNVDGTVRRGTPIWTEDDFRCLLEKLGCAGYGWLRPEGIRQELNEMAANWQGPPPLG